jgi:prepilin-type N-terminal cleavage/methylation domain-containing protein
MKKKNGFTFIEILVVVTVIALLTTVAAVSYVAVNKRSRDAKRLGDLEQVRAALELCRTDAGSYPASISSGVVCNSNTYLATLPVDPKNGQSGGSFTYGYTYNRLTTTTYQLCAYLENTSSCTTGASSPCCLTNP